MQEKWSLYHFCFIFITLRQIHTFLQGKGLDFDLRIIKTLLLASPFINVLDGRILIIKWFCLFRATFYHWIRLLIHQIKDPILKLRILIFFSLKWACCFSMSCKFGFYYWHILITFIYDVIYNLKMCPNFNIRYQIKPNC